MSQQKKCQDSMLEDGKQVGHGGRGGMDEEPDGEDVRHWDLARRTSWAARNRPDRRPTPQPRLDRVYPCDSVRSNNPLTYHASLHFYYLSLVVLPKPARPRFRRSSTTTRRVLRSARRTTWLWWTAGIWWTTGVRRVPPATGVWSASSPAVRRGWVWGTSSGVSSAATARTSFFLVALGPLCGKRCTSDTIANLLLPGILRLSNENHRSTFNPLLVNQAEELRVV
jgi:hypothetical protein